MLPSVLSWISPSSEKRLIALCTNNPNQDKTIHEFNKSAIRFLTKELKKSPKLLEELEKAIIKKCPQTKCIEISTTSERRLLVAHRRSKPQVVYCRLWRWPDLQSHHQISSICPTAGGTIQSSQVICINPYHYERNTKKPIDPILVPTSRIPPDLSTSVEDSEPRNQGTNARPGSQSFLQHLEPLLNQDNRADSAEMNPQNPEGPGFYQHPVPSGEQQAHQQQHPQHPQHPIQSHQHLHLQQPIPQQQPTYSQQSYQQQTYDPQTYAPQSYEQQPYQQQQYQQQSFEHQQYQQSSYQQPQYQQQQIPYDQQQYEQPSYAQQSYEQQSYSQQPLQTYGPLEQHQLQQQPYHSHQLEGSHQQQPQPQLQPQPQPQTQPQPQPQPQIYHQSPYTQQYDQQQRLPQSQSAPPLKAKRPYKFKSRVSWSTKIRRLQDSAQHVIHFSGDMGGPSTSRGPSSFELRPMVQIRQRYPTPRPPSNYPAGHPRSVRQPGAGQQYATPSTSAGPSSVQQAEQPSVQQSAQSSDESVSQTVAQSTDAPAEIDLKQVPYADDKFWCSITYHEYDQRVGDKFHSSSPRVIVDGFAKPVSNDRFCLGGLSNTNRTQFTEWVRRRIGKGATFSFVDGDVFVENSSECSIFVSIPLQTVEAHKGCTDERVIKLTVGGSAQVFDTSEFGRLLHQAVVEGFESVYQMTNRCVVQVSFIKGWGASYKRQSIYKTPCWIEVQLNGPLQWIDKVLRQMRPPMNCGSTS